MFKGQIERNVEVYMDDMLVKSLLDKQHLLDFGKTFQTLRKHRMKLNPSNSIAEGGVVLFTPERIKLKLAIRLEFKVTNNERPNMKQ